MTFYDVKCKRNDKYDVWMDLWVRKHSSQSRELISVCSGQAGSTQLACAHVLLVCKVVCTLMSTFFWLLVLARMKVAFFFIVFKQKKQPKYYLVLTVQIFGIEPPLSLELELRQHMSWVPKAIIIISADGQNRRVICNIMNAPIPNFSWSFDIFCDWTSSSANCIYIICSERFWWKLCLPDVCMLLNTSKDIYVLNGFANSQLWKCFLSPMTFVIFLTTVEERRDYIRRHFVRFQSQRQICGA